MPTPSAAYFALTSGYGGHSVRLVEYSIPESIPQHGRIQLGPKTDAMQDSTVSTLNVFSTLSEEELDYGYIAKLRRLQYNYTAAPGLTMGPKSEPVTY